MIDLKLLIRQYFLASAFLAAWVSYAHSGFAASLPTPRAALHDDVAHVVFDWSQSVQWTDDLTDDQLVLHFDHPVAGDPSTLIKPLSRFVNNVLVSTDKKDVTFKLKTPVDLKGAMNGQSTVFYISAKTEVSAKIPPTKEATASEPPGKTMPITVRGHHYPDYDRLVFQWPSAVGVDIKRDGTHLELAFDHVGSVKAAEITHLLPASVTLEGIKQSATGTTISLGLPEEISEHHYDDKGKVVLDIKPAGKKTPAPKDAPAQQAMAKTEQPMSEEPPMPMGAPPKGPEPPQESPSGATLTFTFDQVSGAAVFNRAGWWWLVFDKKGDADAQAITQVGGKAVLQADVVPTKKGTAVRLLLAEGFQPVPHKDGKAWVIDLAARENTGPITSYVPERQFDFQDRGRLFMRVSDPAKEEVVFRDPEVGDVIHAVPVSTVGAGIRDEVDLPEADLIPTLQGIAMVARVDRAWLDSTHGNVQVAMPGGLTMSHPIEGPHAEGHLSAKGSGAEGMEAPPIALEPVGVGDPIDPVKWARGGIAKFDSDHSALLARAQQERPADRGPANLEVARHYLANGLDAEALGTLRGIAVQDPSMVDKAGFRAVRGIASMLLNRFPEAIEDLSHPSLRDDRKAQMWLAAAKESNGADPATLAPILRGVADDIKALPAPLRMALGRPAAEALLAAGDVKVAGKIINGMDGQGLTQANRDSLAYLGGLAAETSKQYDEAIKRYLIAESGKSMKERALAAHNRIQLQFNQGKITPEDAIHQLKRLPYVWRGGDFEYQTVKQAAQMMIDSGRYREGFQDLHSILTRYSDHPDAPNVAKAMSDLFNRLFLEGEADKMSPIQAIGLYNEFQELTPPGDKGDEMIRKLADRLASVDLLDEASELLRHQVEYRLTGLEKARVAARLALLDLSNNNPKGAYDALQASEMPGLPAELELQRRFMTVQALADLDRTAEALALIVNDHSEAAKKMRADIYWKQKRWAEAAAAIEAITDLPTPNKRLDPVQAQHVVDLATALTLAKDERGIARLRKVYGDSMKASPLADAFDLLTSPPEHGIMDYHKVPDSIKQVQDFQTFMSEWQKRTKEGGLSSLN